ncbi:MAG: glycine cleavage system protein T [Chloroflexi bacterium RBG_19FT_COMBO_47_9]|nr:MAG: glycine cleavage system protein T [Chloroflexi bacterium RBG_16_47_49]OGO66048.1 MAG: glycine cleavage system protein T [Chloroflexi bacterium RBG_19FT_COMBO_47_9]
MEDYLFRGNLAELDPAIYELTQLEAERQFRKLILIPSESQAPMAVREALSSAFQNIYAEGYPREETRSMSEDEILDFPARLTNFRRYADKRYYKGVEYADTIEELARRRCAELFANDMVDADNIYVNVQPLSGAPANNAVYHALVEPGSTIMGMDLLHGGHLTHGSPVNRSGKFYNAVHYPVDPQTEQINYDQVEELARKHNPRFIIAGYSSYPWAADWKRFRQIADEVGAYLFADIAHIAGMVATGAYPSPIGYADVVTFTTHKSLCGPRGACILTFDEKMSRNIDRAVFPGEQGGPHVNSYAGMAVAFKVARTEQFRQLQHQVVKNCATFTDKLRQRGFRIAYGGTNTHMMNLACNTVVGPDGTGLSGDMASRILDIAGIVVNRNTIPGDESAADPSGIRMGTPWVTQRGFKETEMKQLADIIADILHSTKPHGRMGADGILRRAKVDFHALEEGKIKVRRLAESAGIDYSASQHGYPHFYYIDEKPGESEWSVLELSGERVRLFLSEALTSDIEDLKTRESQPTRIYTPDGAVDGTLTCLGIYQFQLTIPAKMQGIVTAWLRDLSDGYVAFDEDVLKKLPGLTVVMVSPAKPSIPMKGDVVAPKPYFIGMEVGKGESLAKFQWEEKQSELKRTPIFETHKKLGAKIITYAGWEMPVWYTTVMEEHLAVRQTAGLFDVAHMGVFQVEGPDGAAFLDSVVANDVSYLSVGESCYTHFLDPDANVIDDLIVYKRGREKMLMVVNAANADKDWEWLNAVKEGRVLVDNRRPWAKVFGRNARLRNLKDPKEGSDMRVDIALQGPRSRQILLGLGSDEGTCRCVRYLKRTHICEVTLGGFDLIISRTGYTGEKFSYEIFVHPSRADELFNTILELGNTHGIKPCGLGARDSLRTEAGLPLYGHEMGGELNLGPAEAGFGQFVKTYKPWFVGREAFLEKEKSRKGELVRFCFDEKGVRMAHLGDPVVDWRGRVIGHVTSCAVDKDSYLTGQAFFESKSSAKGTIIYIYQGAPKDSSKTLGTLKVGERVILPSPAHVLRRFPKL